MTAGAEQRLQQVTEDLRQELDPARVKQLRGKDYLATHDVIRTANRIFGFDGWGHEVVDLAHVGSVERTSGENKPGWHTAYRCTVRVTVAGFPPHDGVGFGDAVEYTQGALVATHELACKEAESDALKRAFRNLGDQFGLILYAKADEKRLIEMARQQEEAAKPADPALVGRLQELANAKGKGDLVETAIAAQVREHGHVREAWALQQVARLEAVAAPAAAVFAEADRAATTAEVMDLLRAAVRLGVETAQAVALAVKGQRREYGGEVSHAWVVRQMARLDQKLVETGAHEQPADDRSVEEAFQAAA